MSNEFSCILYTDGASRGNPGEGGAGAVLYGDDGDIISMQKQYLGVCTNNEAEYRALIMGLEEALRKKCRNLRIYLDSELLVRQINGMYKVKNSNLKSLMVDVRKCLSFFSGYTVEHVERSRNKTADRLANEAIDDVLQSKEY